MLVYEKSGPKGQIEWHRGYEIRLKHQILNRYLILGIFFIQKEVLCTGQHPDPQKPSLHTSNNYSAKRRSPQQDLPQLQNIFIKSRRGEQNYEKINQSNHRSNLHRSTPCRLLF